jgi:TrmH family RNA methyltransferase
MAGALIKHISSTDNPQYKLLKKIAGASRERRKLVQTLLDGVHLLEALANASAELHLLVLRAGAESVPEIAHCVTRFPETQMLVLSDSLFDAISPVDHPTGILGLMPIPQPPLHRFDCCVLLENIQDPGNLGSILRTAAAAGADAVYLSSGCAEAWSPKALRAGMGAHFKLAIHEQQELTEVVNQFDAVFATSSAATQSIYTYDLTGKVAFLFGNEGAGLSPAMLAIATRPITIPMPGKIDSLNVAAAVAVCLFERVRQLLLKPV